MGIHTVIFDLGKTLVPFDLGRLEAGWAHCRDEARGLCAQSEVGTLAPAEFQRQMCALTSMAEAQFLPWWNSIFEPRWLIPPELVLSIKSWARLGLLSNTNAAHYEFLARLMPELAQFDFRILSHEVGAAKPDVRIYEAAEAAAECRPEDILYFDDVPEFVAAARRRGWQAEQFRDAKQVETVLAALAG